MVAKQFLKLTVDVLVGSLGRKQMGNVKTLEGRLCVVACRVCGC